MQTSRKNTDTKTRARSPSPTTSKNHKTLNKQPTLKSEKIGGSQPTTIKASRSQRSPSPTPKSDTRAKFKEIPSVKKEIKSPKTEQTKTKFAVESILEPVVPKKARSAYQIYMSIKLRGFDGHKDLVTDAMTTAGHEWSKMTDKERTPYMKQAEKDLRRHERERKQFEKKGFFVNEDGVKSTELAMLKRSFKPYVTTPKHLRTPYCFFIKQHFAAKKQVMPAEARLPEISQALAKDWALMTVEAKATYVKLAEADQARYDGEMQELLAKGYFVREDGTKSQNKPEKSRASSTDRKNAEKAKSAK